MKIVSVLIVLFAVLGCCCAEGREVAVRCVKPATCFTADDRAFLCTSQSYSCCVDRGGMAHLVDRMLGQECCMVRVIECNDVTDPMCCNGVRISYRHLCDHRTGEPVLKRHNSHNDVCSGISFNNIGALTCRNGRLTKKRDECGDRQVFHCCRGSPVLKMGRSKQEACCVGEECRRTEQADRFKSAEPTLIAIQVQRSTVKEGSRCVHRGRVKVIHPVQPGVPGGWKKGVIREIDPHCQPLQRGEFYFIITERRAGKYLSSIITLKDKDTYVIKTMSNKMSRSYRREIKYARS